LNRGWLTRWKREYYISLKKPSQKYKVAYRKVLRRCRRTWANAYKADAMFEVFCGDARREKGLGDRLEKQCVDQQGRLYNTSESKNMGGLTQRGTVLDVKTNHAQSRMRLTLNNCLSTDITQPPPMEILFKLKTNQVLKTLVLPENVRCSLSYGANGSYDFGAFYTYLSKWLLPWTEERKAANDYRAIFLDSYAVHKMDEIRDLCWSRGYVRIILGGGATPIQCVLDTDVHAIFEREMNELEALDFHEQLLEKPFVVPSRERQRLIDDACSVWASMPLARIGVAAFPRTGLHLGLPRKRQRPDDTWSVSTDGPDDHLVGREALVFWTAADMGKYRKTVLEKLYNKISAGLIKGFGDIIKELDQFSDSDDGGHLIEGEEVDGAEEISSFDGSSDGDDEKEVPKAATKSSSALVSAGAPLGGSAPGGADAPLGGSAPGGDKPLVPSASKARSFVSLLLGTANEGECMTHTQYPSLCALLTERQGPLHARSHV
jgi:hypothetical protein